MYANEIHALHDRHHEVSPSLNTIYSVKDEVPKVQIVCICGHKCLSEVFVSLLNGHFYTDTSWKRLLWVPAVFFSHKTDGQSLNGGLPGVHMADISLRGHLVVVPAVYILEKVTTLD